MLSISSPPLSPASSRANINSNPNSSDSDPPQETLSNAEPSLVDDVTIGLYEDDSLEIASHENCCQRIHKYCTKIFTLKNAASGCRYLGFFISGMGVNHLIDNMFSSALENFKPINSPISALLVGSLFIVMGQKYRPDFDE